MLALMHGFPKVFDIPGLFHTTTQHNLGQGCQVREKPSLSLLLQHNMQLHQAEPLPNGERRPEVLFACGGQDKVWDAKWSEGI